MMETTDSTTEPMAELLRVVEEASRGERDPESMRRACEDMDRIREEIRHDHGVLDIGVSAVRELRDGAE